MNKIKITVETKSRSKVVSILESALSKAEFQNDLFNIFFKHYNQGGRYSVQCFQCKLHSSGRSRVIEKRRLLTQFPLLF